MKVFHCDQCNQLLFFENSHCIGCGRMLAYVPGAGVMTTLPENAGEEWTPSNAALAGLSFRLCRNYTEYQTCNWAVPAEDVQPTCQSCRLTGVIPDVSDMGLRTAWYRLEIAKRRLVFTLLALGLMVRSRDEDADAGMSFEFKADPADPAAPRVLTGHANGVITVNVAEADDAERERRRVSMAEPYRTLLGHMRHESGHYYWDLLVKDGPEIDAFRVLFGDERRPYADALEQHYQHGAPDDWQSRFVSSYASAHPWEDWAETWAHYLHMVDALETAAANGLAIRPRRPDEPTLARLPETVTSGAIAFERLIDSWFALTYALNNLNRSLGLPDGYPFVLSAPAVEKLRFVHALATASDRQSPAPLS